MRIGQLARAAGVTVQTVRYYEQRGLVTPPARRDSGYRDYSDAAVDEIRKVLELKALGFTIAEIRAALGPHSEDGEVCRIAADKVHALEAEIRRLSEVLKAVKESRRVCGCDREPRFQSIKGRSA
jgi:DNA-binding transcriptional MerR regulator